MSDPDAGTPEADGNRAPLTRHDVDRLVMQLTGRRRLGKYVLLGRIGHGGMGKIYLAYAPGPHGIEKLLVVKRLHSHLTTDPVLVASFLDEARLSMALSHPNIVSTFDVGDVDGRYFMVMEYIDGQNLGVVLRTAKRSGQYPSSGLWAGMFTHVLEGLHAAHQARDARGRPLLIIHRDVSPQNLLITYEGIPKIVDFGIAKAAMRVSETDAGVLKGKYAYMSPEQVRGEPLDARSDVFAAGVVLWEMLAGRRLYKADSVVRSVERILTEAPISPVRVNAECDPEIAKVAFKALQKDREHRFHSAHEMKDALEDAMERRGLRARQADVRDLMQRLFSDVIERQRIVLESALAAGDAPLVDDDEPVERHPNDSESDVSMRDLRVAGAAEHTTPSRIKPSPLVTGDSEMNHDDPASRTSIERRRPGPAPADPPRGTQTANTGVEATETASGPVSRRSRAWIAAVLTLSLSVVTVVAWGLVRSRSTPAPITIADAGSLAVLAASDAGNAVAFVAPTIANNDAGAAAVAPSLAADAGAAVVGEERPDNAPAPIAVPMRAASAPARKVKKAPALAPTATEPAAGPRADVRSDGSSEARAEPRVDPKADPNTSVAQAGGFLSLDTVPWTVVYLGDKKLGETPLVNVPVPAGTLELLLVNGDAGIKEAYIAKVKPGETFRQRLDLQ